MAVRIPGLLLLGVPCVTAAVMWRLSQDRCPIGAQLGRKRMHSAASDLGPELELSRTQ
jgi:hypothetical protein